MITLQFFDGVPGGVSSLFEVLHRAVAALTGEKDIHCFPIFFLRKHHQIMHQAVALNILRQLHNILLGICLPEDFVVRIYANIVQCNIPCFVFNAFMPCGQITDNFSCIAIIGINFAKLCIRRAGTFLRFPSFWRGFSFPYHFTSRRFFNSS